MGLMSLHYINNVAENSLLQQMQWQQHGRQSHFEVSHHGLNVYDFMFSIIIISSCNSSSSITVQKIRYSK